MEKTHNVLRSTSREILAQAHRKSEEAIKHLNASMKAYNQAEPFWLAAAQLPRGPEKHSLIIKAQRWETHAQLERIQYEKKEGEARAFRKSAQFLKKEARTQWLNNFLRNIGKILKPNLVKN